MRKILFIALLFYSVFVHAQTQVSINRADGHIQLPVAGLSLQGCISLCGTTPVTTGWIQTLGRPLLFSTQGGSATILSGFVSDSVQISFFVIDNSGKRFADTLTLVLDAPINKPPVVVISKDTVVVQPQNNFILDASKSFDPDGKIISYQWSGTGVIPLSGPFALITAPILGTSMYSCTVTDDAGAKTTASFKLTVNPAILVPKVVATFTINGITYSIFDNGTFK